MLCYFQTILDRHNDIFYKDFGQILVVILLVYHQIPYFDITLQMYSLDSDFGLIVREKMHFPSIFSYLIELQTLNEKCCVLYIICYIYQIERCHFLEPFGKFWVCQNEQIDNYQISK